MSVTTVRLQSDVELGLESIINTTQRSKNWLINQAIREFISRQTLEQQRWTETLQAIESVSQGKLVAGEQVNAWLQSWGTDKELPPPEAGK